MALGGNLGLGITLTASDLASGAIKSVAKSFAGLDSAVTSAHEKFATQLGKGLFGGVGLEGTLGILKDLSKAAGIAAAGVAGLGLAFKLADGASDFEYRLAELRNTTKLTGAQVDEFQKRALDLGSTTTAGPKKIAEAFRELASSTLTGDQALKALEPTLDVLAASFGRLSPEQAGGLVAKTLEAFPELANNSTHAVDLLARAFRGGLKPEEIANAMEKAAKGSKFLGRSLEEVLQTLAGAAGAGLSVNRLSKEMLQNVVYTDKFLGAQERMRLALLNADVTAKKAAEAQGNTWRGFGEKISAAFETLAVEIGLPLIEVLKPVVSAVVGAVQTIAKWIHNISAPVKKAAASFLVLGSLALVVAGIKAAFVALLPVIGSIVAAAAPFLAIGVALAAASYLAYQAWESNFGGIRDTVLEVFGKVRLAVESLVELFTTGEISGALADDLLKAENGGIYDFVEGVSRLVATFRSAWEDMGPSVIKVFQGIKNNVEPIIGLLLGALGPTLRAAVGIGEAVLGVFAGNLNTIMRGLTTLVNAGVDMVNGLIEQAANATYAVTNSEDALNAILGKRLDHVTSAQLAYGLGADETAADLAAEDEKRRGFASGASGSGVPASASATGSGLPSSSSSTTLPNSSPVVPAAAQDNSAANAQLVAAIEALGKRPVIVNGVVQIDGMKLADFQAKERRDRAAAAGTLHVPHHSYGSEQ